MTYVAREKIIAQPEKSNHDFSFWISENICYHIHFYTAELSY